jgi:hypothetical protein
MKVSRNHILALKQSTKMAIKSATAIDTATPMPAILEFPDEAGSLEGVAKEGLVVVGGGRFVNSAEATPVIIDSAASTTPEQIEPRLDVCV